MDNRVGGNYYILLFLYVEHGNVPVQLHLQIGIFRAAGRGGGGGSRVGRVPRVPRYAHNLLYRNSLFRIISYYGRPFMFLVLH